MSKQSLFGLGLMAKSQIHILVVHLLHMHRLLTPSQSDMPTTVYTTMKKCVDMSKEVGQEHSIQTFDQQLYAVSQQVKWSMRDVFRSHILRLWGFHTLSCFTACIFWGNCGLMGDFVIFWSIPGYMLIALLTKCFLGNSLTEQFGV